MEPARHDRLKDLFQSALDVAPTQRAAYIAQHTPGDPDLSRQVLELLQRHESADGFLDPPALSFGTAPPGALDSKEAWDAVRDAARELAGRKRQAPEATPESPTDDARPRPNPS